MGGWKERRVENSQTTSYGEAAEQKLVVLGNRVVAGKRGLGGVGPWIARNLPHVQYTRCIMEYS